MGILFGTDGIRGIANEYPINCETLLNVGRAISHYFCGSNSNTKKNKILVGCDTRISGDMVVNAVTSGICSMGTDVVSTGVLPTPGIACLVTEGFFDAGIVVSASHNKFYDNGIKIFDAAGHKISRSIETKLESMIIDPTEMQGKIKHILNTGQLFFYENPVGKYCNFLESFFSCSNSVRDIKLVLDCSNGATSICAPYFFKKLGADVTSLFCSPNGTNINENCGSEHPETLARVVLDKRADLGLAFDGDGDRLTAVSELGEILTGDQLLAIFASDLKNRNLLDKNNIVVSSIMSNLGLTVALKKMKIEHIRSGVGDKNVVSKMMQTKAVLGGENSGHFIFLNRKIKTGDAILAGLKLVAILKRYNSSLSKLLKIIKLFPQCLINVDVSHKPDLKKMNDLQNAISMVESTLNADGRVVVRYSGTQKKCRIMVEGKELTKVKELCSYLAKIVYKNTN